MFAANKGHTAVVRMLLSRWANVDLQSMVRKSESLSFVSVVINYGDLNVTRRYWYLRRAGLH